MTPHPPVDTGRSLNSNPTPHTRRRYGEPRDPWGRGNGFRLGTGTRVDRDIPSPPHGDDILGDPTLPEGQSIPGKNESNQPSIGCLVFSGTTMAIPAKSYNEHWHTVCAVRNGCDERISPPSGVLQKGTRLHGLTKKSLFVNLHPVKLHPFSIDLFGAFTGTPEMQGFI